MADWWPRRLWTGLTEQPLVKVVQARLGHASAPETLDTYSHLRPDSEDRTRRAVDEVLGASAADLARTSEA